MLRILPAAAALTWLALLPPAAHAQPACLPDGGGIYLCDPLDDGSTVGDRNGGTFVEEGWRVDAYENRILYDLGEHVAAGTLSVFIRGISMESVNNGTTEGNKHHLIELFSGDGYAVQIHYGTNIRLYGNEGVDPSVHGKVKYQFGSWPNAPVECADEVYLGNFDTSIWDGSRWFNWTIRYGDGLATCYLDGDPIAEIQYDDCPVSFRYLFVPILPNGRIDSIGGLIYSHVSFAEAVEPGDDDDTTGPGDDDSADPGDDDTTGPTDDDSADTGDDDSAGPPGPPEDDDGEDAGCSCKRKGSNAPHAFILPLLGLLAWRRRSTPR